ncbi:MAG: hypothetical protein IID42_09760, partial [Planctomycetes bacterium]|nr:hypothetical protein [Planctomycetota bacterium]
QGPEENNLLFRKSYVARCLACGHRHNVSFQGWRRLPLPESGDAHETWSDKKHLMQRAAMTAGQTVFVLLGLIGMFVAIFLLVDVDDKDRTFTEFDALLLVCPFPVLYGLWWVGRLLFPPERVGDKRCAKCGYDLTDNDSGACPECGVGT